jgi:hypothetical protein
MTMLKTACRSLKSSNNNTPLKAVGPKVKFALSHPDLPPHDQMHLQASDKKRRYQRRGSKPQMMADLQRIRSEVVNENFHSLHQTLLSNNLLLQELLLLDESDDHERI